MNYELTKQIINFIDQNDGATFDQVSKEFNADDLALNMFEQLLADGQIRQVVANKLLGTYKYVLAA